MTQLPPDIDALITRIYRQGDTSLLPRADRSIDHYDDLLRHAVGDCQIVNITEFDYGCSYRYLIVLSRHPDAAALDKFRALRAVRQSGPIEIVTLAVSVLVPYAMIRFVRERDERGEIVRDEADGPFSDRQKVVVVALMDLLRGEGLGIVSADLARRAVPDVQTELCVKGEATVADCLFFG